MKCLVLEVAGIQSLQKKICSFQQKLDESKGLSQPLETFCMNPEQKLHW